jgi:hypothetical protein
MRVHARSILEFVHDRPSFYEARPIPTGEQKAHKEEEKGKKLTEQNDGAESSSIRFEVRPNPSRSSFIVKYELPSSVQEGDLVVRDQLGKILYQKGLDGTNDRLRIPGDKLATGVHYASIRSEDGSIRKVKKIVKMK